jgi:adenylate kinase
VCGAIYNIYTNPPKKDEVCDHDGAKLTFRKDDSEEAIGNRLQAYEKETLPLTDYYRQRAILTEVDGDAAPEQVTRKLFESLDQSGVR